MLQYVNRPSASSSTIRGVVQAASSLALWQGERNSIWYHHALHQCRTKLSTNPCKTVASVRVHLLDSCSSWICCRLACAQAELFSNLMLHRRPKERAAELGEIHIVDVPHISREHADHDASHIEDWHQILPIARQRIQQEEKYAAKVKWPFASGVHSVSKTHWSIVQTFNYYYTHPASWRRLYQWQWQPSNCEAHQTVPGKTHGANQNGNTHEESALLHHRACPYLWDTPHSRQIMHQTLTHSLKRPNAKVSSDFDSL